MKTSQDVINCTNKEAVKIGGKIELAQLRILNDAFEEFYWEQLAKSEDHTFAMMSAISNIFTLGYVSGVRAERNKKGKSNK